MTRLLHDDYGISLDTYCENWIKAIEAYILNWPNISDLKGWNNIVAKQESIGY